MKRIYNHPQVNVAHLASMTLMQAASPTDPGFGGDPIGGDPGTGI